MADLRWTQAVDDNSVTIQSLAPNLRQTFLELQLENLRLKYLCGDIEGKDVAKQLDVWGIDSLTMAETIGSWEINKKKFIDEIVAQVFNQLYNGKRK